MKAAEILESILAGVVKLDNPKIAESRIPQLREFIKTTINGDQPQQYLCINANLGNNKRGAIIYILTNVRIIKSDVDPEDTRSSSFTLDSIVSIDRRLMAPDRAEVVIKFQNDLFGIRYAQNDQKITEFFQQVDQARILPERTQRGR